MLWFFFLIGSTFSLAAQEDINIDVLFEDPAEDIVAPDIAVDHMAQYVQSDAIRIKGYFDAIGGVSAGWMDWPNPANLSAGFDRAIGLTASAYISFDAKPDPAFHFYSAFSMGIDPLAKVFTWNGPRINTMYVDYTFHDSVFTRMGVYEMTWGQGRIFAGYTNLLSDLGSSFSARASVPTLLDGFTVIGLMNTTLLSGDEPTYKHIAWAAKADKVLFGTMISLAGRYQVYQGLRSLLSMKKVVLGVDILTDVLLRYYGQVLYPQVLAGFFKEWDDAVVYGEYFFDGADLSGFDHTVALAAGFNNVVAGKVDLGLQWAHAFIDGSGVVTAGLEWTPWKYITATLALPVAYGAVGSRYVTTSNGDIADRRLALLFGLELEVNF